MTSVLHIMEEARIDFMEVAPYFTAAMLSLAPFETTEIPTFAVTPGSVMLYNPEFVVERYKMKNGLRRVSSEIWHEVNHVVRDTFNRLPGVNQQRNNFVSDLAINSSGLNSDWIIGDDWIQPSQFKLPDNLTMEEYHQLLPDIGTLKVKGWKGCGSGAGVPLSAKLEEELDAKYGRSDMEKEAINMQVAMDIERFSEGGKFAGKIPGGLIEWAKALRKPPKVPWTATLNRTVRYCTGMIVAGGGLDTSYQHPALRTYTLEKADVIIPGEVSQELVIAFVLDTSGSMGLKTEIEPAIREARGALTASGVRDVWWIEVDHDVAATPRKVSINDLNELPIHGRGGTSFVPGFEAAEKLRPRPDLLIYFTDGYGGAPAAPPNRMTTIWVLFGTNPHIPATWGHKVFVKS